MITLEEAVRQLTQVPAALFGLRERGVLRPGWHADLVVFDPDAVAPGTVGIRQDLPAGEPRVYAEAESIHQVFVNGVRILDQGRHTGSLPGKVMRSGIDTRTPTLD